MVWFSVEDNLAFHQKTLRAGNAAMGLWVRAGSWCAQQLTDGFVPTAMARTLGTPAEARRLVDVRLWIETDGGYQFWQWAEDGRQRLRSQVEAERKDARERQRRAREKVKSQRDGPSDSARDADVSTRVSADVTSPVNADVSSASPAFNPALPEVPNGTSKERERPRKRRAAIPDDWNPTEQDIAWQRSAGISIALARRELPKFLDHWRGTGEPKADWSATWRNWLRRTVEREPRTSPAVVSSPPREW